MLKQNFAHQFEIISAPALAGFFVGFNTSQQQIEQALLMLELSPDDDILLHELQENIVSIQKSLERIGFDQISPLTASLNKLLQAIRLNQLVFETLLSDLVLLAVDDIKMIIEKFIDGADRCVLMSRLPGICESIGAIAEADEMHLNSVIRDALLLLDPGMEIIETSITQSDTLINLFSQDGPDEEELSAYGVEESDDFIFFRALSEPLENRENYWRGRVHRMLRLALKMNDEAGRPVDPNQLAAAVYMHDAGMALLPMELINSEAELTQEQRSQVKEHPVTGYELMRYMKNWREAALIVIQHHEQVDGNGYPYGLNEREICEGAKILAIVDAVDARTHERVHATLLKRPLLRAAIELGKYADVQFSEKWVDIFKDVFQEMRKVKEASARPY
ncbi:hypothetical protein MNBD_GAMMA11-2310 [hydrothermal vent metagenome]|uniref:HD-GYP domain-containing protein n=1 Tax=hydrothermal vent metagenome TaxID=652676 RepID=A0A3B0XFZ4_9ZZZZ